MTSQGRDSLTREFSEEELGQLRLVLGKRIYKYNTVNPSDVFGLKLKDGLHFEGSLKFFYSNGGDESMKVLTMTSKTMVDDLLPLLIERFCFQNRSSPDQISFNSSENYILMKTGGGDRRLLADEQPLQLALDVVEHTSHNPVFWFCSNITEERMPLQEEDAGKRSSKFLSSSDAPYFAETSSRFASNGSLRTPSESDSPAQAQKDTSLSSSKKKSTKMSFLRRSPMVARRTRSTNPIPLNDTNAKPSQTFSESHNSKSKSRRPRNSVATLFNFSRSKGKTTSETVPKADYKSESVPSSHLRSLLSPNADLRKVPKSVLLHIYGPTTTVASGQVYKTVLVAQSASTAEVIMQALERYGIKDEKSRYVLMDTIGREETSSGNKGDKNDVIFVRLCTRQLHKEEIPVLLDRLWKPANNFIRRFELVRRSEVPTLFNRRPESDNDPSSPVLRTASGGHHDKFSDSSSTDLDMLVTKSEDEFSTQSATDDFLLRRRAFTSNESLSGNFTRRIRREKIPTHPSRDSSPLIRCGTSSSLRSGLYQVPQGSPYLLNLTPSKQSSDHILFQLGQGVTELGIFQAENSVASDGETAVIHLSLLHETFPKVKDLTACRIYTPSSHVDEDLDTPVLEIPGELKFSSFINCSLNGHTIFPGETYELHHTDLIQINQAMYMFVDPAVTLRPPLAANWTPQALKELVKVELQGCLSKDCSPLSTLPRDDSGTLSLPEFHDSLVWNSVEELEAKHSNFEDVNEVDEIDTSPSESDRPCPIQEEAQLEETSSETSLAPIVVTSGRWILNLLHLEEDSLLDMLTLKMNPKSLSNKLAVGYMVALGLEYHKVHNFRDTCKDFMGRVLESLQLCIMKSCKELSGWKPDQELLLSVLPTVYPLLGGAVFWLSNVLAVTSFVRKDTVYGYTTPKQQDALANLVHYTLQELSYPVTRVLYAMVQLLLDVAVLGDNDESAVTKHVNQMIDFLQLVLYAFEDHSVPKSIISQFFGNLFCFISGSLVNLLLEGEDSGDDTKVLSYTCASQLQKDFDLFQGWSMGVALEQEATKYLSPLMSILSFLSTPEEDLIRWDWSHFRAEYPSLHPAQLKCVLDRYSFASGSDGPAWWYPPVEELEEATNTCKDCLDFLKERFEDLPQIEIPSDEIINLSQEPPDVEELTRLLRSVLTREPAKKPAAETSVPATEKRDSPCPDSGLDSPARVGETGRTEVPHIVVDQSSSDRHLSVESTSCVLETVESVQTIEVESLDVVREQPPPVHIVTDTTPTKPETTPNKPGTTPTKSDNIHTHPTATKDFILSRGSRDFGISLALSPYAESNFKPCIVISSVAPISLSEESDDLMQLSKGDVVLKIDGMDFGSNLRSAEQYLKDAEDEVTVTVQMRSLANK
jgi:hypothetical protein